MSNRGRHKKKKPIQNITFKDLMNYINSMRNNDTFYNFESNAKFCFNPYFLINEQGTTSKTKPTSSHSNIR